MRTAPGPLATRRTRGDAATADSRPLVLVAEDDRHMRELIAIVLRESALPMRVVAVDSALAAMDVLEDEAAAVVVTDLCMPGADGLELLRFVRAHQPLCQVLLVTGFASIDSAIAAIRDGAFDYVQKPFEGERLRALAESALNYHLALAASARARLAAGAAGSQGDDSPMVGRSAAMQAIERLIEAAAAYDAGVLVSGESGVGKELVVRRIHQLGARRQRPFIAINCAAIPETLIESELFGHERGAFSGATTMKRGQFEQADGGTLFLDEIADMSLSTQAKVLRALQEQQFTRVGGTKLIKVDVRVLAASNKDLLQEIDKGTFREDLFYRLNVVPIVVPTLRDRREDIPLLVKHFLRVHAEEQGLKLKQVSPEAMEVFMHYEWPGNIRELRNLIERLMIMVPGPVIEASHASVALQVRPQLSAAHAAGGAQPVNTLLTRPYDSLRDARNAFEKEFIARKLREHHWNISRTAEDLKIERSHLHRKIKLLDVEMRPEM